MTMSAFTSSSAASCRASGSAWTTPREAARLGLRGYVRNLPDGTVEIVAEGPLDAVDRLIAWARHGPPGAVVAEVQVTDGEATGELTALAFVIEPAGVQ